MDAADSGMHVGVQIAVLARVMLGLMSWHYLQNANDSRQKLQEKSIFDYSGNCLQIISALVSLFSDTGVIPIWWAEGYKVALLH